MWKPRTATLKLLRQDWANRPQEFIELIRSTEEATGVPITAETYKRPPQEAPIPELERFYAWKSYISCEVDEPFSEATFGPALAQRVGDFLNKLIPLYEYLNQFKV